MRYTKLRLPDYYVADQYVDFPATCLNWWAAWAYARWAGTDLPSSTQWEITARGTDGRLFPWGDEAEIDSANCADHWAGRMLPTWDDWKRAHNAGELRSGYPTLPGQFQHNLSPSGCWDMAGNVWEWTATVLADGQRAAIAGGSYDNPIHRSALHSRGAYRLVVAKQRRGISSPGRPQWVNRTPGLALSTWRGRSTTLLGQEEGSKARGRSTTSVVTIDALTSVTIRTW